MRAKQAQQKKERFYNPDVDGWKYRNNKNTEETADSDSKNVSIESEERSVSPIDDNSHKTTIKKNFEFFNWTLSFTKNVVQACFILFLIVNIFIAAMITYIFFTTRQAVALEIYISEVYKMFITVIGGYIIKSTTENTIKIVFSVLSDWLEKKYGIEGRLKEPEDVTDTIIFTGNRPTPNTGALVDGGSSADEFTDYGSDPDDVDEDECEEENTGYKAGQDESGE